MKQRRECLKRGVLARLWLAGVVPARNRIFPSILQVVVAIAGPAPFALSQTPLRALQIYHAPRTLPLTAFYDTPDPLPAGKPGALIRSEQFDEYHLSYDVTAFRILYHSRSARGDDVAVSGVVLMPEGTPPTGGWPVIAWAHNFSGFARQCAPSLIKNLMEGPLLSMYVGLGYAVVVSDYAGLGTNFPYAALDSRSNAQDVMYSIPAARVAVPQLASKWVVAGLSLGALVALSVAENTPEDDSGYLGALAISGLGEPGDIFTGLGLGTDYALLVSLAQGIKTVFPDFRVESMLTDKAIQLLEHLSHSCEVRSGPQLHADEMLKRGWENNRYVKEFFNRNRLVGKPARGPLLVIGGESDSVVPLALTAKVVSRLCEQKDRVAFVKYPGVNSSAVLGNSVSEQTSWIRARFAGLPAPSNCP
ncbi:MAG: lipase family protein [Candidatus Acidiferrum sp.]